MISSPNPSIAEDLNQDLLTHLADLTDLCLYASTQRDVLVSIVERLYVALSSRHRVFVCGNGGSAALSQHFAAEFVGRFENSESAWPVLALTADGSILTALANDFDRRSIFTRQIDALGLPGDVLLVLSTSGVSLSILDACQRAHARGMETIGLVGCSSTSLTCDLLLTLPDGTETAQAQEVHLIVLHILCRRVRALLDARC